MSQLPSLPATELPFLATMFSQDAKNYHVWSYRQWLVQHFSLWEDNPASTELAYVEHLLDVDVRNNSAWNHRWFIVFGRAEKRRHERVAAARKAASASNTHPAPGPTPTDADHDTTLPPPSIIDRELTYTQTAISLAPQNPSPWNYLRGILRFTARPLSTQRAFAERFANVDREDEVRSSHALDFLADVYGTAASSSPAATGAKGTSGPAAGTDTPDDAGNDGEDKEKGRAKAGKALELLARRYDPIRRNYWNWRRGLIGLGDVDVGSDGVEV